MSKAYITSYNVMKKEGLNTLSPYLSRMEIPHGESNKIRTATIKKWAMKNLRRGSILRENILKTDKELSVEEMIIKVQVWLDLLNGE